MKAKSSCPTRLYQGTNYVVNALLQAKGKRMAGPIFEGPNKNIAYYAKRGSDPRIR